MKIVILNPYFQSLGGGEKVTTVIAEHFSRDNDVVVLVQEEVDVAKVQRYFDVDLSQVRFELLPKAPFLVRLITHPPMRLPGRWNSLLYDCASLSALKKVKADLFINNLYHSSLPSPSPKSIYMCMFPQKLVLTDDYSSPSRKLYNQVTSAMERHFLGTRQEAVDSYSVITANSKYTASWIKRYWGHDSDVVYPVCDSMGPPEAKKNIILHVGRFFGDNGSSHHKKQHELIKAFIQLGNKDWELHLAGSAGTDPDTQKFMKKLQGLSADNSKIYLHPNISLDGLQELYRTASIYWHATGLGYDQEKHPENQEHFGITTVEAMSAGVVPIVINSAGQREVVQDGKNGRLWDTVDELVQITKEVIKDTAQRKKLSTAAAKSSKRYSRQNFVNRLDEIIMKVCNEER